ncbi:MAG TPA: carboxypeptidase-like regulatory domain-containing protein [Terriglobales bacterium]|nr:carboxypeptidase-like regulatory domain-containing protein [Terriglobales bacterium]
MRKTVAVVALLAFVGTLSLARDKKKKKKEDRDAIINFLVVRASNGKPVRNAAVVLHEVDERGHQAKGGYELKTDLEGKTSFDGVPYGKLRVQVLAPGLQTFGQDYDISEPVHDLTIKMNPPQKQYSVYDDKK